MSWRYHSASRFILRKKLSTAMELRDNRQQFSGKKCAEGHEWRERLARAPLDDQIEGLLELLLQV